MKYLLVLLKIKDVLAICCFFSPDVFELQNHSFDLCKLRMWNNIEED